MTTYGTEVQTLEREIRTGVRRPALAKQRRVAFYSLGAATALALDALRPGWHSRYLANGFSLLSLLPSDSR